MHFSVAHCIQFTLNKRSHNFTYFWMPKLEFSVFTLFSLEPLHCRTENLYLISSDLRNFYFYSFFFLWVKPFRSWNHCDSVQDFLSIFDGKNTDFPELARVCGGDSLPDIVSSGPDMLIVFQTSPYDSLFHPTPVSYLLGFELQVEVSLGIIGEGGGGLLNQNVCSTHFYCR